MEPDPHPGGRGSSAIRRRSRRDRRAAAATLTSLAGLAALIASIAAPALPASAATSQAPAAGGATVAAAAAGARSARPAVTAGTLRAWGSNVFGALGTGNTKSHNRPVRVRLPRGVKVSVVRSNCDHTLALTSTGSVLAWGRNVRGQLGNGTTKDSHIPIRVALPKGTRISAVRAGCDFSLALTTTGKVLAWGDGEAGELGDGSTARRLRPVLVKLPAGIRAKAISVGFEDAMALTTDGHVLAWGEGAGGELGNGATIDRHRPVKVKLPAGAIARAIAAGVGTGFAVTSQGTFAWGANNDGQLGLGDTTTRDKPARITLPAGVRSAGKITQLAAGTETTYGLTARGKVLSWGGNPFGELGNGTDVDSHVPVMVMLPAGTTAISVSSSGDAGFALTASGRVLAWGGFGLGDGSDADSFVPVKVLLASKLRATAIGSGPESNSAFAIVIPG
jgi:alpha-tubulin suppressor-like RCC1 family protein